MLDKLLELTIDWAAKKRRWPLLSLLGGTGALFYLVQKFFDLSFHDTLLHAAFLLGTGLLGVVSGILYWLQCRGTTVERRSIGSGLVISGSTVLAILLFRQFVPPSLAEDKLVVIVAKFSFVTPEAEEEAANLSHRIAEDLEEKAAAGAPLVVRRLARKVDADDEEARHQAAMELGASRDGGGHVPIANSLACTWSPGLGDEWWLRREHGNERAPASATSKYSWLINPSSVRARLTEAAARCIGVRCS